MTLHVIAVLHALSAHALRLRDTVEGVVLSVDFTIRPSIDSIVKGLETGLINTFPADSPRCAVDNIVDSFHGCF